MTQKFTGKVTTDFGGTDLGQSVAIQSDGKILVGGSSGDKTKTTFALVRYNSDGTLDADCGNNGKVTTDSFSFFGTDTINEIKIQSDGKILAAGTTGYEFAVARYNADGSLDTTFDTDGKQTAVFKLNYNTNYQTKAQSIAIASDNTILLAGSAHNYDSSLFGYGSYGGRLTTDKTFFALVRYYNQGVLDATFDKDGKLTSEIGGAKSDSSINQSVQ